MGSLKFSYFYIQVGYIFIFRMLSAWICLLIYFNFCFLRWFPLSLRFSGRSNFVKQPFGLTVLPYCPCPYSTKTSINLNDIDRCNSLNLCELSNTHTLGQTQTLQKKSFDMSKHRNNCTTHSDISYLHKLNDLIL